ncbi:hypothetical protein Salat_2426200 [Sesamum alatum]|uniref:Uncharacterized protein n=1 Tax=Sesamum alatum TaxID=300844 RepID=A0AAE1XZ51_9LAMI|nr:hypothetical protein Salat_2426200 [Sesamum alatum]
MAPTAFLVWLEYEIETFPLQLSTFNVPSPKTLKVSCICLFLELPSPHASYRAAGEQQSHLVRAARIILFEPFLSLPAESIDEGNIMRLRLSAGVKMAFLRLELWWRGHGGFLLKLSFRYRREEQGRRKADLSRQKKLDSLF